MSKQATAQKLVPKLRFPEFQNAGAWEKKRINQISKNIISGGTPSTLEEKYWNGDIRWMNSGELNLKSIYEVQGRITKIGLTNSSTKLIPKKCVLIGLAGQGKTRGTVAINMVELCTNQSIAAILPNEEYFNSYFLYHNLDYRYDELRRLSTGSEGRGGLNLQIIKFLNISLPAPKEQQKIADCLSSLDDLITTQTKKLTALQQHKKGLMQTLFPADGKTCPKLRFPEFSDKWGNKKIGDIATLKKGSGLSKSKLSKHGKYKCILYGELFTTYNETINKVKSRTDFNEGVHSIVGDVLLPASTTTTAIDLANTTLVNENNILLGGDINIIRPIDKYDVDSMFLTYILAYNKKRSIAKLAQGVTIIHLYGSSLEKLIISIPNPKEQQKIADCLSSLDNLITTQTQKLTALQQHKKGLMQNLFPSN